MSKMVLVTGSSGYIGGQTVLALKDHGHTVIGVDSLPVPDHLRGVADRAYQEDFASNHALELLHKFDPIAIIHCAGTSLVGPSMTAPDRYYHNNFVKTKTLLDRLHEINSTARVIFSSSAAVYGNPVMTPCQEVDPTEPISPYGESKIMIEWMMRAYSRAHGLDYVALRYFNACGAASKARHGQRNGATHIIARVLESVRDRTQFVINGNDFETADGTCIRDYVHVSDIAQAHVEALDRGQVPAGVYNLGTAKGASNLEIVAAAEKIVGQKIPVEIGPRREGDPAVLTADPARFRDACGWQPRYDLNAIIQHAWAWYTR